MKKTRNANKNMKPNNCNDWTMATVSSFLFCSLAVDISKLSTVTYQFTNNKPDYIYKPDYIFTGTVSVMCILFTDTVSVRCILFTDTVSVNNLFLLFVIN